MVALDVDSCGEFFYSFFGDLTVNLSKVCARVPKFGVEQFFDKRPVVREEQSPFAIVVEAACSVDPGREAEFIERLVARFGRELAQYAKGLVE